MIIPTGKIDVSITESLEILAETPLNTKPKIIHATGDAWEGRDGGTSNIEKYAKFAEKNNITYPGRELTVKECAIIDAYIKLIQEASKAGNNAAEIVSLVQSTESKYGTTSEVTLTARVYRLPNRE